MRIPDDGAGMHIIDVLHGSGRLTGQAYTNACALLALWRAAGLDPATTGDYTPRVSNGNAREGDDTDFYAETEYHRAMLRLHQHYQYLLTQLLRGGDPGPYLPNVKTALGYLDYLPRRWNGERWAHE